MDKMTAYRKGYADYLKGELCRSWTVPTDVQDNYEAGWLAAQEADNYTPEEA